MQTYTMDTMPVGLFRPVKVPVLTAGQQITPLTGALRLGGWSFLETTGAAIAQVELWDGGAPGGETLALISLAANDSKGQPCPGLGLYVESGLTVNVLAGSIRGSIWLARA